MRLKKQEHRSSDLTNVFYLESKNGSINGEVIFQREINTYREPTGKVLVDVCLYVECSKQRIASTFKQIIEGDTSSKIDYAIDYDEKRQIKKSDVSLTVERAFSSNPTRVLLGTKKIGLRYVSHNNTPKDSVLLRINPDCKNSKSLIGMLGNSLLQIDASKFSTSILSLEF